MIVPVYEVVDYERVVSVINKHYSEVSDVKGAGYQFCVSPSLSMKGKFLLIALNHEYGDYYLIRYLKDRGWVRLKYFIDYDSMRVVGLDSQLGGLLFRALKLIEGRIMVPRVTVKASLNAPPSYSRNLEQRTKPVVIGFDVREVCENYLVFDVLLASTVPPSYLKPVGVGDGVVRVPVSEVQEYPCRVLIKTRGGGLVLFWNYYGSQVFVRLFADALSSLHYKRDRLLFFGELAERLNIIWNSVGFGVWEKVYSLTPFFSELSEKTPAVLSFNKRGEAVLSVKGVSVNVDKIHKHVRFYRKFLLTPSNKIVGVVLEVLGLSECEVENAVVYNTPCGGVPVYFELKGLDKVFVHSGLLNLLAICEYYKLSRGEGGGLLLFDVDASVERGVPVVKGGFKFDFSVHEVFHHCCGLVNRFWVKSIDGVDVVGLVDSVIYVRK